MNKDFSTIAIDSYNMSASTGDSVMGYVVPRQDGYYDVYIKGTGAMKDYSKSPFKVGGYNIKNVYISTGVTSIGGCAFYNCRSLTSIEIPDSVTSIGSQAFLDCANLQYNIEGNLKYLGNSQNKYLYLADTTSTFITSATINTNCKFIGSSAFNGCTSLTSVTIPDSVASIGYWAFNNCESLTSVTIGDSVTSIGHKAFYNTSYYNNTSNWENKVLYMGKYLIEAKTTIEECEIKEGTLVIADSAFAFCTSLTSVTIPDSVTTIGDWAFSGCTSLTSVTIGDSVTSIGHKAFSSCESLTSVTIGDSVTTIGDWAFAFCTSLTSITMPDRVTSIAYWAFSGCPIENASIPTIAISCISNSKLKTVVITSGESIGSSAFASCTSLTSITIGNSVTSIGDSAFKDCTSLKSVNYTGTIDNWVEIEFGSSYSNPLYYAKNLYINGELVEEVELTTATTISSYAFAGCGNLTSIEIPDSVTSIGEGAFAGCTSLTSIEIPDSITSIGKYAFGHCTSLISVTIGDSVTSIGDIAFYRCCKLVEVINKSSHITIEKGSYSNGGVGYFALVVYNSGDTFSGASLSNDNGYIIYADGNEKILVGYKGTETELVLPTYITKIYQYAFYKCSTLISVTIGNSVTSIGDRAFAYCESLTSITIGDSVTTIGDWAFYNCTSLTSVVIGDSVTSIGYDVFSSCANLQYNIEGDIKYLGNNQNKYLYLAETTSTTITSATINSNCKHIGSSAFSDCESLTSIEIPDSVTSIGNEAFSSCESLTSVTIGDSVTSIGNYAFYKCESLTNINFNGTKEQWNNISKGSSWKDEVKTYVTCSDGTVKL